MQNESISLVVAVVTLFDYENVAQFSREQYVDKTQNVRHFNSHY